jgi:hypothetical protein
MAYYRPKGSFGAQPIHIPRMQPAGAPLEDMHFDDCLECGAEASLFVDDYELCDDPQIMSAVRSYSGSMAHNAMWCKNPREIIRRLTIERREDIVLSRKIGRWS